MNIFKRLPGRLDKSLILLGLGLLIGASLGLVFSWLEETGSAIFQGMTAYSENAGPPRIGKLAPDFELLDLDGKPIRLSHLKGQPVMINFWATWCPPCREEIPLIEEVRVQFPDLVILAVDADESESTVRAFVQTNQITTIVLLDPGSIINDRYYVEGLPTSYFIDNNGVIRSAQIGVLSKESLLDHLGKIGLAK